MKWKHKKYLEIDNLYFNLNKLIEHFEFVKEYGYELIKSEEDNMGVSAEFSNKKNRLHLTFDYKDFSFYFFIIKGKNTIYPNENDLSNIISFWDFALKNDPDFDLEKLKPNKEYGSINALKENVLLLKKYGKKILETDSSV